MPTEYTMPNPFFRRSDRSLTCRGRVRRFPGRAAGTPSVAGLLLLLLLPALAGCSATRVSDTPTEPPDTNPAETIRLSDYEDFDPTPYADPAPAADDIQHDVPERLMEGKVPTSTARDVQGYRIQIFSSQDKTAADRAYESAVTWWRDLRASGQLDTYRGETLPPPVYLVYLQPYYRVRVGNFASRSEALDVLQLMDDRFPEAFIAPDTVTLTR